MTTVFKPVFLPPVFLPVKKATELRLLRPLLRRDLQSGLATGRSAGSGVPTFTRNTISTIIDFEGLVRDLGAGENGVKGGRGVVNLITASEDMTNGAYAAQLGASIDSATEMSFDGTAGGSVFQATTITDNNSGAGGRTFVFSAEIALVSGTASSAVIRCQGNAVTADEVDISSALTSTAQRFSVTVSTDAAGTAVTPVIGNNAVATFSATKWQLEEVTGQANQNPSEYVSTGVGTGAELLANSDAWVGATGTTPPDNWTTSGATGTYEVAGGQLTQDRNGETTGGDANMDQTITTVVGKHYAIEFKTVSNTDPLVTFTVTSGTPSSITPTTVDSAIQSLSFIAGATSTTISVRPSSGVNQIVVWDYISIKEADHGANVDGVQWFDYHNGNTVSSGVVTEAKGAKISAGDSFADAGGPDGSEFFEARTNVLLHSNDFSQAAWTNVRSIDTQNYAVGSDGQKTMQRLIDDSSTGSASVYQQQLITVASGTHTLAFDFKKDQLDWCYIQSANFDAGGNGIVYFDLTNGAVGTETTVTGDIEDMGNGIYRCSITFATTTDLAGGVLFGVAGSDNVAAVDLDGTSSVLVGNGQLESGAYRSPYIPTGATSVTRDAATLDYPAANNIRADKGTISFEFTMPANWVTATGTNYHMFNAYTTNQTTESIAIRIQGSSGTLQALVYSGSSQTVNIVGATAITADQTYKVSLTYTANNVILYLDGVVEGTPDTICAMPLSLTTMNVGYGVTNQWLNGTVRKLRLYDRPMSIYQVSMQ